jgi:MFS family permease
MFLLGFGLVLCSFSAKSVGGLFFTYGIVVGVGNGLCFLVCIHSSGSIFLKHTLCQACGTLPSQWFKRKRGLANGLVFAGSGLGGRIQSIVFQIIIDEFNVAWAFRILGLTTLLVTVPAAVLLRERRTYATARIDWYCHFFRNQELTVTLIYFLRSFFQDIKFVLLFLGSGIAVFPLLVSPFFIPMYAPSLNISAHSASVLLGLFNIASGFGRVGLGYFCDVVGPLNSLCVAIVLSAISALAIWPASNSLAPFVVFILINGLGNGGFFATIPTVVASVYSSKLRVAFALVVASWSVGYLMVRIAQNSQSTV